MTFWGAVDDPDVVPGTPEVIAHLLEAWTVEESGHRNEADNSPVRSRRAIKNLPGGPAPEVDVEIAEMLGVGADAPLARRLPRIERRRLWGVIAAGLDPAASPFGLLLVRRITNDNGDRLAPLDRVRLPSRFRNRPQERGKPLFLDVGTA